MMPESSAAVLAFLVLSQSRFLQFGVRVQGFPRVFPWSLSCRAAEPEAASEGTESCCPILFWAGAAMQG